jgi:hypothetical protein
MKLIKSDIYAIFAVFIMSTFFVLDLFLIPARPSTFDIPFHITNMAQFYLGLVNRDFPVVWNDGIGNYGLPMSIVAHQLTSYLGAIFIFITHSPLTSFKIVSFLGIFFSSFFYYLFLRIYFKTIHSFAGTFLYTFASYKIINFYIRGAMPEVFSAIFLPLILMGMYLFINKRNIWGLALTCFSFFLLSLNHPMMLLIYSSVYFPYLIFLIFLDKESNFAKTSLSKKSFNFVAVIIAMILGIGMAGYYLIPLNFEIKYFYYGQIANHLTPNSFLNLNNIFGHSWRYFTDKEILTRGHIIFPGIIEIFAVIIGIFLVIYKWVREKQKSISILEFSVFMSVVILISTTPIFSVFYNKISLFSDIQFPWRMLSAFIFITPIIYAYIFSKLNKPLIVIIFIAIVSFMQFPQLYGKNYTYFPESIYFFTKYNPHSVLMNTIWSGKTEDYPIRKDNKAQIIEGDGKIISKEVHNSIRKFRISAVTPLALVDYTFYFPGWNVYVDGDKVPIEFQNKNYRGVIIYRVPAGTHNVVVKFEDTKIRSFGKLVSAISAIVIIVVTLMIKRIKAWI